MKKNASKDTERKMDERNSGRSAGAKYAEADAGAGIGRICHSQVAGGLAEEGAGLQRLGLGAAISHRPSGADLRQLGADAPLKFPINGYDVDDPGVDLENWTLTVERRGAEAGRIQIVAISGAAAGPAEHAARLRGRLGRDWPFRRRAALGFSADDRRRSDGALHYRECADDYYESLDMATALHPQTLLCYEMYEQPLTRRTWGAAAAADSDEDRLQAGEVFD